MYEKKVTAIQMQGETAEKPLLGEREKRRVAVYCRVSTMNEAQEGSYEQQKLACQQMIAANPGLELAGIYGDQGKSGSNTRHRPAFCRMMEDCRRGRIDLVMTKSISRFARNLVDTTACVRELKELGIPVLFEKEGINSLTASGELLMLILAAVAQEESNNISRNIQWSYDKRCSEGNPTMKAHYGYRKIIDGGLHRWEIDEPAAARVRLMFDRAEAGWTYRQICEALEQMDKREGKEQNWYRRKLIRYLTDVAYTGDLLTNQFITADYLKRKQIKNRGMKSQYYIEEHHPAIISREQFERVGQMVHSGALEGNRSSGCRRGKK